jgi:hypothetical protein
MRGVVCLLIVQLDTISGPERQFKGDSLVDSPQLGEFRMSEQTDEVVCVTSVEVEMGSLEFAASCELVRVCGW